MNIFSTIIVLVLANQNPILGPPIVMKDPPEPTKEIVLLFQKLEDDNFEVRELAAQKLSKIGWPTIKGLERIIRDKNYPFETRKRARLLVAEFFSIWPNDHLIMPIWYLAPSWRFSGQQDLAVKYFKKALKIIPLDKQTHYNETAILATLIYKEDLLRGGHSREAVLNMLEKSRYANNNSNIQLTEYDDEGIKLPKPPAVKQEEPANNEEEGHSG